MTLIRLSPSFMLKTFGRILRPPGVYLAMTLCALSTCTVNGAPRPSQSVRLDVRRCRPSTDREKSWLSREWTAFERFTITCPVQLNRSNPVLFVLSVDGYEIAKATRADAVATKLPAAIIVSTSGTRVGMLPYAFPFDPPVTLDVNFSDWSSKFPLTIQLYLENPAVGGNSKLPSLRWNKKLGRYEE